MDYERTSNLGVSRFGLSSIRFTMRVIASLSLLISVPSAVLAHGGHEHPGPAAGETIQQYAQRHVCRSAA